MLTVNQFFTAGLVVAQSNLLTVLPSTFVAATGYEDSLVTRELPFERAQAPVEMLWHVRDDAAPAHAWLRALVQQAADARR